MNSTIRRVCACLLVVSLSAVGRSRDTAHELNSEGYALYKKENYPEAMAKFEQAAAADSSYATAHYNLACTMGILRKMNQACDYDVSRSRITAHLQKACELDPGRVRKMKSDPDLDVIRDTYVYQTLVGLDPKTSQGVTEIIRNVRWWGPQPLAATLSEIQFRDDGTFVLSVSGYLEGDGDTGTFTGTCTVHTTQIVLTLDRALNGRTRLVGELKDGMLTFPGVPGPFTDSPEECRT